MINLISEAWNFKNKEEKPIEIVKIYQQAYKNEQTFKLLAKALSSNENKWIVFDGSVN